MAAKTGNNYISGTLTDSFEIPTPNSGWIFDNYELDKRLAK